MIKFKNFKFIRSDIISGFSVATLALPQNMAYALIAGLDPIYGLYTSIIAMLVASFIGPSKYLIVGPTNMMALAVASSLGGVENNYLHYVLLFTFMVGFFQLLLVLFRLGELINYVSRSVISGLISGVALLIISGQLGSLAGIEAPSGFNIIMEIYYFFANLQQANSQAILISFLSISIIFAGKYVKFFFPRYLVSIMAAVLITYLLGWQESIQVVEHFPGGLPAFTPVELNLSFFSNYWMAALSVALLGFIHVLGAIKSVELHTNEKVKFDQILIEQGIINIICSFFSSFVVSGSFTKSFANVQAGAKSRLSQFFAAATIALFITFFQPVGRYIPISALSGLVIMVAIRMIDLEEIKNSFRNRFDAIIFASTFFMTILSPRLDYAIYFGVLVSLILVLKNTSSINYSHFNYQSHDSKFFKTELDDIKENEYIVINLSGNINFHTASSLERELNNSYQKNQKFIIRMRDVDNIDLSSLKVLEAFIDRVQKNDGLVIICGLDSNLKKMFEQYNIDDKVGKTNIFSADDYIFSSTKAAIKRAEDICLPISSNNNVQEEIEEN